MRMPRDDGRTRATRAIVVTARQPKLGAVKTRLASVVGDREALRIYTDLLARAFAAVDETCAGDNAIDRFVAVLDQSGDRGTALEPPSVEAFGLRAEEWHGIAQRGADLGERLGPLFWDLFLDGYETVLLLNGDSPDPPVAYLRTALASLDESNVAGLVLGPAADGGFYLIATDATTWRAHGEALGAALLDARLGTSHALADVEAAALAAGLDVRQLPLWVDVDTADDLPVYERLTGQAGSRRSLRGEPPEPLKDVYLHVTNRCGLGCPHCYNRSNSRNRDELSTEEWRDVVDQCVEAGAGSFVIIGGDPFLRDDLFDLVEHITAAHGRKARIFFNGPCDHSVAARLADAGHGRLRPLLSLDGTRDVNDLIRGTGNHDTTLDGLGNLAALGLRPVVNTVLLEPVLPTLPDLAREIKAAGAAQLHLILPHERGAIVENAGLVPDGTALRSAVDALTATAAEIDLTIDNIPAWRRRLQAPRDFCTAGCRDVAVDPFGRVYACTITCGDPAFVAGDLHREPMAGIWRDSPALRLVRAYRARDREECVRCPVVDACGGECWVQAHYAARAHGRAGGLRAPFPYCDLVRPLFEQYLAEQTAGTAGPACGPRTGCAAESAGGGQAAAGEAGYALFDCI